MNGYPTIQDGVSQIYEAIILILNEYALGEVAAGRLSSDQWALTVKLVDKPQVLIMMLRTVNHARYAEKLLDQLLGAQIPEEVIHYVYDAFHDLHLLVNPK